MKRISSDPIVKLFISVIGIVVIVLVLKELKHILLPFTIAYVLFFVFEPLNKILIKWKFPKSAALIVDLLIIFFLIYIVSNFFISSFGMFVESLPKYESKLNGIISKYAISFGIKNESLVHFSLLKSVQNLVYGDFASDFFTSTISLFTAIMFVLLFYIFIYTGHSIVIKAIKNRYMQVTIRKSVHKYKKKVKTEAEIAEEKRIERNIENIKKKRAEKIEQTFKDITDHIQQFISIKFVITLILGFIVGLILYLFGVKFYIVFGVLTVLLNFIPNLGSVIGVGFISIMVLIQFESMGFALLIAGILIVVQNIVGNIIEPKIFGDTLGLNPLVILISLLVWGYIWGIVGMFLAVPLTAIIKIILSGAKTRNLKFINDLMGTGK